VIIGNAGIWADTFPEELIPRILDLVVKTWGAFDKPSPSDHEVPITRRFRSALKQAKDLQRLPVRIDRESAEDNPHTGDELGRIDLKFCPATSALEEVYFAFECKRLNAIDSGVRRTLAPEYVSQGMLRFITGQYGPAMTDGGMLGYVLDGNCNDAIRLVERNVTSRAAELNLAAPAKLNRSSVRPANNMIRETAHNLGRSRNFRIHHVFLDCLSATKGRS
jgi:hypothetical protein